MSAHPHLLPVFLVEAEFCLDALQLATAELGRSLANGEAWRKAARAAHTLKGNAAMMEFQAITDTAFAAELHAEAGLVTGRREEAEQLAGCLAVLRRDVDALVAETSAARRVPAPAGAHTNTDHS